MKYCSGSMNPSALRFPGPRRFDIACLGRLAVDLYAQQVGARLEDVAYAEAELALTAPLVQAGVLDGVARLEPDYIAGLLADGSSL